MQVESNAIDIETVFAWQNVLKMKWRKLSTSSIALVSCCGNYTAVLTGDGKWTLFSKDGDDSGMAPGLSESEASALSGWMRVTE